MAHFHGIRHGNCVLRYNGGILELRKLDFSVLNCQFDVKKANFRGLIPKIDDFMGVIAKIALFKDNFGF